MPPSQDLLIGKIAARLDFVTTGQVEECLRVQEGAEHPKPLGQILIEKGYLTSPQLDQVLSVQRENLEFVDPKTLRRKESFLFGRIVIRDGFCTEAEVNECLRAQASPGNEIKSLGEIMAERGYLTANQVRLVLAKQQKKIMGCASCRMSFTVITLRQGKEIPCPRCRTPLAEGAPDILQTDAEFDTKILPVFRESAPTPPPVSPPSEGQEIIRCVICDHEFAVPKGQEERVRCPACNSTFARRSRPAPG